VERKKERRTGKIGILGGVVEINNSGVWRKIVGESGFEFGGW